MRLKSLRLLIFSGWVLILSTEGNTQNFSFNCSRDTLVPGCPANLCITLKSIIPDIHGQTSSYIVNPSNSYSGCLPVYVAPNDPGGTPSNLTIDDRYTSVINIGFPFPFFGITYNDLIASTNGVVSFDISKANAFAHWNIINGGTPQNLPSTFYDRAIIMGPYHDLDPSVGTSPTMQIQYQSIGTAPHRKWVFSFYKVPLFSAACNSLIENTHQIILYESTGIVEVTIFDKQICAGWNQGRSMIGMQDFNRTQGIMIPGRQASDPPWGSIGMNESWRFTPAGGPSLFKRVELYNMTGTLLATGTTTPLPTGCLEASFSNVCAPAGTITSYIVKSVYEKIDDPTVEVFGLDTVRINRANPLTGNLTPTPADCGVSNGTITVTGVTGGTPPYQYSLDNLTWQSSNIFNNLAAGTYTVYIRDNPVVCQTSLPPITVTVNGTISETHSVTPAICPGSNTGSIIITAAGGTGPYTFSLNGAPAVPGTIPYTFNNLAPIGHTILVNDLGSGCNSGPQTVFVPAGAGVTASSATNATSCIGVNNGSIIVNALTGAGPFTWSLDGAPAVPGPNPYTFPNVSAGVHNVVITDIASGCISAPIPANVGTGVGVTASYSSLATSCPTATNGSITVTALTGTAPFTWSLDGAPAVPGLSPYTFPNISAGSHNVVITDNNGCTFPLNNISVSAGPVLTGNNSATATSCSGASNGTITVTPTGGTAPFTFSLDGGPAQSGPAPYTFPNISAGLHNVVITDAAGCISNPIPVNVSAGPPLVPGQLTNHVLCNGTATGVITLTMPPFAVAPFQFSLDGVNWQSSNVFSGLIAGSYTLYYQDANGCFGSHSTTVLEPTALTSSAATVAAICNGQSNGVITITAGGGVGPYQYSINGGSTWQASNVFNVPASTYNIIIRDANNCTRTQSATVTEPAVLTAASNNSNASCNGGNDGVITVNATGGNAGYTYSLDGVTFQPSNVFNVAPGNYTVTVKDNLGCSTTFNTTVGLTNDLTFTPQTDVTICEGTSTQLQLVSNGLQYAWTPATALSSATIANPVASPTVTTQYTVTVTFGRCTATDDVIVNVNAAPIPNAGPDGFICYGQSYQLQGSGGTQYTWTPSTYLSSTTVANPVSTPSKTITYTLSQVKDAIGCTSLVTDDVIVDVTPPIKVKTFPFDTVAYAGDQFQLNATSIANIYTWTPAAGLSNPNIANPVVTVGPIGSDVLYQVTASTIAGCKGEGYVRIKVYTGPDIYVPSGFTPNSDGKNDKFTPFPVGIASIKYFRVFNRWGQLLFSTNKLNDGWDGKFGGVEQPSGVYVWIAEGITKDNKVISKKGTVTLIR